MMKDLEQIKREVFEIYNRTDKKMLLISGVQGVLSVMQEAAENGSPRLEDIADALYLVNIVLEEQTEGLSEDTRGLMKIAKGEGDT